MQRFEQGGWVVEYDPEATASVYASHELGFAERCSCVGCRNLMVVREEAFPADVRRFLQKFGIDYRKEADATQFGGPPEGGLYPYSGFFNLVGKILADPGDMTALNSRFKFFFVAGSAGEPMPEADRLRLEFELLVPWAILEKPEASV